MPQFFVSTAKGLVEPLELEVKELGFKITDKAAGGVYVDTNWEGCYRLNLQSRLASRILKPVLDFTAYQPEELYGQILRHDFTKYIKPNQTISIDATVKDGAMRDQRFVAMKVKDAIVDQFREKFGVRPDVDNENPAIRIYVRAVKNQFNVSVDTSGDSLFKRGYRKEVGDAPLKENLAAGLIKVSGWDRKSPLVDFMCGSGTFLIEAAMMALNIAPGMQRKRFAFQNFIGFDIEAWERVVEDALAQEKEDLDFKLYGFDIDRRVLANAKDNAKRAGVDHVIEFRKEAVATVEPPAEKGLIVVNPPYGARIGDEDNLRDVYRDLGYTLKHRFKGWDAWILSGNKDLIQDLKLKSTQKHFVFNGNIECRFLKYSMF
ncbi:THUMP domain-containing class I SAM-dependent RNA methyltransferase [Bdellovibrio sp. HCB2-146]|uniref:THUMP domain-containing class I SAM-dependent RNA methyltransferase n=1 Tax=Bdellovibrio sp. HCB2-146 TaxID=3394362 RepID=UPI0039BCB2ED